MRPSLSLSLRPLSLPILILVLLVVPASALQARLAGLADFHIPLIGPALLSPTPPSLHHTPAGERWVGITSKNVLACLDGRDGKIVWRHLLDEAEEGVVSYHVDGDSVLLLTGPSATTAHAFNLTTGHSLWTRTLRPRRDAQLTVPLHLGTDAQAVPPEQGGGWVVLSDGRRVTRLDGNTGEVAWSMDAPGSGSTILFKQLLVTGPTVHLLALTSSFASPQLSTLSLSLSTSVPLGDFTQLPSILSAPDDALLAPASAPGAARIVWYEHGRVRSAYISESGAVGSSKDLLPGKGRMYAGLVRGAGSRAGVIMAKTGAGRVDIIDVRQGGKILDNFEGSDDSPDHSDSVYSSRVDGDDVLLNRVYWSFSLGSAVAQTYRVDKDGGIVARGFTFPFDTTSHGVFTSSAVLGFADYTETPTLALTTSSGAIQLIRHETHAWTKEEGLADLAAVQFVDLAEREVEDVKHLAEETFAQRSLRHLTELRRLPAYLLRFVSRLTASTYSSTLLPPPLNLTSPHRDQFGLQKLLVAATHGGKLYALDSTNGRILWTRNLGALGKDGSSVRVEGMWLVREVELGTPTIAVVGVQKTEQGERTVGFHVDAFSGEVSGAKDERTGLPLGKELFSGSPSAAFPLPFENCGTRNRVMAVANSDKRVHLFPPCKKVAGNLSDIASTIHFTTRERTLSGILLEGHVLRPCSNLTFASAPTWSRLFPTSSETLLDVTRTTYGAIASFGRPLGDKSTLYKYLNPHLSVVTTLASSGTEARVYVIDTTSGKEVYAASVEIESGSGGSVKAAMTENWLVYAWKEARGWRMASVEVYEDREKAKAETPGLSSWAGGHDVKTISQTFILSTGVKELGFTRSKFGITAKELVLVNDRNQVASIPRRALDPRRPVGKPTSADKEEMLVPYEPGLPHDPKRVVSHNYEVLGARSLESSPALVESTSLLLAHGLDLFLTRALNPSGTFDILSDSFNKAQLLLTLAGLSVGIALARPAVRRKALRAKWY